LYFYHGDHLSSTQMITDANGAVQQQVLYAPFGEVISEYNAYWHQGKIPDYQFNAKEKDEESGMYYYSARYYAPPVFISRDPLFEKYPFMSPYAYCANNPVIYIDPTGEELEIVCPATQEKYAYTPGMDIPDGASEFVSNAIAHLNTINKTESGGAMIGELHSSTNTFSIIKGNENTFKASDITKAYANQIKTDPDYALAYQSYQANGKDISGGSGGTITWNPEGTYLPTTAGRQKNAITDLAHELFHGLDANRGLLDDRQEQGVHRSEWQATYNENILRGQLNAPLRTHYRITFDSIGLIKGLPPAMLDSSQQPIRPSWY
jgi:RHS repeat-associated protein